jgi:hypothetical protein
MTDNEHLLDVSVNARWTAKLPADIDPCVDLRSDEEVKDMIAEEIGVKGREEVIQWEIHVESEVTSDG